MCNNVLGAGGERQRPLEASQQSQEQCRREVGELGTAPLEDEQAGGL